MIRRTLKFNNTKNTFSLYLLKNPLVLIFKLSPTLRINGAVPGLIMPALPPVSPKFPMDEIPNNCCVDDSNADVLFLILIAGTDCGRRFFSSVPML